MEINHSLCCFWFLVLFYLFCLFFVAVVGLRALGGGLKVKVVEREGLIARDGTLLGNGRVDGADTAKLDHGPPLQRHLEREIKKEKRNEMKNLVKMKV